MSTPRILIYHRNADEYERLLRAASPGIDLVATKDESVFLQEIPEAEILITLSLPRQAAAQARRLRWVQAASSGVERFVDARDYVGHLPITNARGIHSELMADYVLAGMVMARWDFPELFRDQAARVWTRQPKQPLSGSCLGIVGLGPIGREIARRAAVFGMRVLGVRKSGEPVPGIDAVYSAERLDEILPECDFLTLALPTTNATRHLIGMPQLKAMKRESILINISRGFVVDEPALIRALQEGEIAGAVLDVFAEEPLPADNPLWDMKNVIVTPHISGLSSDYEERFASLFLENLRRFQAGEPLLNTVDLAQGY